MPVVSWTHCLHTAIDDLYVPPTSGNKFLLQKIVIVLLLFLKFTLNESPMDNILTTPFLLLKIFLVR